MENPKLAGKQNSKRKPTQKKDKVFLIYQYFAQFCIEFVILRFSCLFYYWIQTQIPA